MTGTAQHECPVDLSCFCGMIIMGIVCLDAVIFNRNGLSIMIQAYKATLLVLCPTNLINPNFCSNPSLKKLMLVHDWQVN
jgi:hypothetical protein